MKKYYGNILQDSTYLTNPEKIGGNFTEFYNKNDYFSARTLNRPLLQLSQEKEAKEAYEKNIFNALYNGRTPAVISGYCEGMDISGLRLGKLINNKGRYIRIPTGIFTVKTATENYVYYNIPKIELFERQIADHFNIDLNDQDNEINVYYNVVNGQIQYTAEIIETAFDYTNRGSTTVISNNTITKNISSSTDMFSLVEKIYDELKNRIINKDDYFSLEEIIPIKKSWEGSGEYIIFFNPNLVDNPNASFSYSKKFGMLPIDDFEALQNTTYVKLYKVLLNVILVDNEFGNIEFSGNAAVSYLETFKANEFFSEISALDFKTMSARKYKTDIQPTKFNALKKINDIDIVDFYWKNDEKKQNPKIGFIADDTDEIFSTKEKNRMDIYNCVGMLLKAVQELSAENNSLKNKVEILEKKLN